MKPILVTLHSREGGALVVINAQQINYFRPHGEETIIFFGEGRSIYVLESIEAIRVLVNDASSKAQ